MLVQISQKELKDTQQSLGVFKRSEIESRLKEILFKSIQRTTFAK